MKKVIHIELLPNFEEDDFTIIENLAKGKIEKPEKLETNIYDFLRNIFPKGKFYFFSSARAALTAILFFLKERFPGQEQEVYTQAFSCLVVANAIRFAGLKPVFIDIEAGTAGMSRNDLLNKITSQGLALILQNTFGLPDNVNQFAKIAQERNLFLIENLAHTFGAQFQGRYLGNFGDFAIVSFDNTKVVSALAGGLLVINRTELQEEFQEWYQNLPEMASQEVVKRLHFALWLKKLKKIYHPYGKYLVALCKKIGLTPTLIKKEEKQGKMPKGYLSKFHSYLYPLLWNQLQKLFRFNQHRKKIAEFYLKEGLIFLGRAEMKNNGIFLRYPLSSLRRDEILANFKTKGIYLGDWYRSVLAPAKTDFEIYGYQLGSCREAEKLAMMSFNLPTHINISEEEAAKIVTELYPELTK